MEAGRRLGAWVTAGGVAGYFVPPFASLLVVVWPDGLPVDLEGIGSAPFALFFLLAIYTITGLCVVGISLGMGCGFACAWLPRGLRLWQRLAVFAILVLLIVPALYYILPFWPVSFSLG
jgi:hypothetical protein